MDGSGNLINAAIGLIDAHHWQDAMALLDFQDELTPNNGDVYQARAHIYNELGRRDEALALVRRALEINPNNENAKNLLEKLEKTNH